MASCWCIIQVVWFLAVHHSSAILIARPVDFLPLANPARVAISTHRHCHPPLQVKLLRFLFPLDHHLHLDFSMINGETDIKSSGLFPLPPNRSQSASQCRLIYILPYGQIACNWKSWYSTLWADSMLWKSTAFYTKWGAILREISRCLTYDHCYVQRMSATVDKPIPGSVEY